VAKQQPHEGAERTGTARRAEPGPRHSLDPGNRCWSDQGRNRTGVPNQTMPLPPEKRALKLFVTNEGIELCWRLAALREYTSSCMGSKVTMFAYDSKKKIKLRENAPFTVTLRSPGRDHDPGSVYN